MGFRVLESRVLVQGSGFRVQVFTLAFASTHRLNRMAFQRDGEKRARMSLALQFGV